MIIGFHEKRSQRWIETDPEGALLEGVLFSDFSRHPKVEEVRLWLTIQKKPSEVGQYDETLLKIAAKSASDFTPKVIKAAISRGMAERLATNEAVTPELVAEGVRELWKIDTRNQGWVSEDQDRLAQIQPLINRWDADQRERFEDQLGGVLQEELLKKDPQLTLTDLC